MGPLNVNKAEEKNLNYTFSLGTIMSVGELRSKVESDVSAQIDLVFTCKPPYFFPRLGDYDIALYSQDRIEVLAENRVVIITNSYKETSINTDRTLPNYHKRGLHYAKCSTFRNDKPAWRCV